MIRGWDDSPSPSILFLHSSRSGALNVLHGLRRHGSNSWPLRLLCQLSGSCDRRLRSIRPRYVGKTSVLLHIEKYIRGIRVIFIILKRGLGVYRCVGACRKLNKLHIRCRRRGISLCLKPELSAQAQRRDASTSQSGPFATE
jgi:hypothetical protein